MSTELATPGPSEAAARTAVTCERKWILECIVKCISMYVCIYIYI